MADEVYDGAIGIDLGESFCLFGTLYRPARQHLRLQCCAGKREKRATIEKRKPLDNDKILNSSVS